MIIKSLDDIYKAIPNVREIGNELHSPCPMCNPGSFMGDDRFFWQENRKQFYCRHCGAHSIEAVAQVLFDDVVISPDLQLEILNLPERPHRELVLYDEETIETLHNSVHSDYWRSFNWSDATIEKFKLGYGKLYPGTQGADRHIIPFIPRQYQSVANGYALEGRLEHPYKNEPKNVKTAGVTREYFTEIVEGDSSFAYICEGVKDAISAYEMGFRHIYAFFGNTTDLDSFGAYIASKCYETVVAFTHNDVAGEKYKEKLREHLNLHCLVWPHGAKKGYDLTNLLEQYGSSAALYVTQNLYEVKEELPRGYIEDVRQFLPDYVPPEPTQALPKEVVREELPEVLKEFVDNYQQKRRMAGKGLVKVLGSDPGSGKSYALVHLAEELAKTALREFEIERTALDTLIEEKQQEVAFIHDLEALEEHHKAIENLKYRREHLSCATVLFAGPFVTGWQDILDQGADENLWYNYEARGDNNCENFYTVSQLASKGYVPMAYCQWACPLKSHCEKHGYLSQEAQRRAKPITYVRHQQLITSMVQEYKYIIIDENCLAVFDTPIVVDQSQLIPTYPYWDNNADAVQVKLILELVEAVRNTLRNAEPNRSYSGREVIQMIDDQMLGKFIEVIQMIDPKIVMDFQPKTVMQGIDTKSVPVRCLPILFQVLLSELPLYLGDALNYNSGLHIVNQNLELYALERLHIPSNRAIIISDGTPLPQLYGLLFDREVESYSPQMYNPQSQTIVYTGSDFTITSIRKQLGSAIVDFQRWLDENDKTVYDVFQDEFDLNTIPFDENIYDSPVMRRALALIKMCAERHQSLLFVTYKPIRALLEHRVKELYPDLYKKIHFAHYWSLRGTNRYKDVEAVLLIGCPRIPYDSLYRRIQAWGKLSGLAWIPPTIEQQITPYFGSFRYDGYTHPNFTHPFAKDFVDMIEAGEVRQSLERIRQHTSGTPKYAYLAIARSAAKWVTIVNRVGNSVNNYENENFRAAYEQMLNSWLTTGKFPPYNIISSMYHLSNNKISAIKRSIQNGSANKTL